MAGHKVEKTEIVTTYGWAIELQKLETAATHI